MQIVQRWQLTVFTVLLGIALLPTRSASLPAELLENNGGHYRFSNIRWKRDQGNTVTFTIESAWRRDFGSTYWQGSGDDGFAVTGDVISLNGKQWPILSYGDDSMTAGEFLKLHVRAYSVSENWIYGSSTTTHTYPTPNNEGQPWMVSFTGCCKLSEINNIPMKDAPWRISALVDLHLTSASPRLAAMPLYSLPSPPLLPAPTPPALPVIPTFPVSFYVPGFHPSEDIPVSVSLADAAIALQGAPTPISVDVDPASGLVTLDLHGITQAESQSAGQYYFLKLNCTCAGAVVQADLLLRVQLKARDYAPQLSFGHLALANKLSIPNVTLPPGLDGFKSTAPTGFYPEVSYQAYLGFAVNYTLVASDPNSIDNIGFGAIAVPEYARLSAVKGLNPSSMQVLWIPCASQVGRHVTCYEAVDASGNASTPECVDVTVDEDPAPIFGQADDDGQLVNMTEEVVVTMGATKHYTLFAYDINCLDSLHISIPEEQLAPGMELHAPATAPAPFACAHSSPTHSIRRQLTWDAPFNYGGNVSLICFSATDACGRCACAGHADVTTVCVTFRVQRCKYSVGVEHQLAEVGALYGVSWLQLWKMNPPILHPDYILFQGQAIDIGRLLVVSPNDSLYAIAKRYGTDLESLYDLNMDLGRNASIEVGMELCIVPDSCKGERNSVFNGASELRAYRCAGRLNTNGILFSSLHDCVSQCGEEGACSSISRASGGA